MSECSICLGEFSIEEEGGVEGDLGILPVAFCPTCYAGIYDMITQSMDCCGECGAEL